MMKTLIFIYLVLIFQSISFAQQSYKDNFNKELTQTERANYKQQIYECSQKINSNKKNPELLVNRGVVYSKLGYHSDAISDYNNAIKIDSTFALAYFNRGISRSRFKYTKMSCADIKKAYELGLKSSKTTYLNNCKMYISQLGRL